MTTRTGPLNGIKVIELAGIGPGPYAGQLLADMGAGQTTRYIPQVLAVMGAILVGLAAMSFVAANWAAIPKAVKLAMLFTLLWSAWAAALVAHRRGHGEYASRRGCQACLFSL